MAVQGSGTDNPAGALPVGEACDNLETVTASKGVWHPCKVLAELWQMGSSWAPFSRFELCFPSPCGHLHMRMYAKPFTHESGGCSMWKGKTKLGR